MDVNGIPLAAAITAFGAIIASPLVTIFNTLWADRNARKAAAKAEAVAAKVEAQTLANTVIAEKVEATRIALEKNQTMNNDKLDSIHNLVDGNMSEAKKTILELRGDLKLSTAKIDALEKLLEKVMPVERTPKA